MWILEGNKPIRAHPKGLIKVNRKDEPHEQSRIQRKRTFRNGRRLREPCRQMMKAGEIPVIKLGHRELIPAWWLEDNFVRPNAA